MDKKEFYNFLNREVPQEGGCMLCKVVHKQYRITEEREVDVIDYLVIERHKTSNGDTFTINDRFWYDYENLFNVEWEVIYKRHSA